MCFKDLISNYNALKKSKQILKASDVMLNCIKPNAK